MDLEEILNECGQKQEKLIEDCIDKYEIIKEIKIITNNIVEKKVKDDLLKKLNDLEKII